MDEFTFDVTAQPTGSATATYNDTITLITDIPNEGSAAISLSAKGLPGGISPSQPSLDFPATNVEATSSGQNVTLTNCGTSAINVQSATITGTDSGDFAVVLPSDPTKTLQLQDAETFTLVMSPHSKGIK